MNDFIHLADSWTFYSPFPPQVTSWLAELAMRLYELGIHG